MRYFVACACCGQIVLAAALANQSAAAQSAQNLREVHRVYLQFPANKPALHAMEADLAKALQRGGLITIVTNEASADAVLTADGDVYIKGYVSLNPRAGRAPGNGEPIRGGFLSVELKGARMETLWSYLATPKPGSSHVEEDLSRRVTRELTAAIREVKESRH